MYHPIYVVSSDSAMKLNGTNRPIDPPPPALCDSSATLWLRSGTVPDSETTTAPRRSDHEMGPNFMGRTMGYHKKITIRGYHVGDNFMESQV